MRDEFQPETESVLLAAYAAGDPTASRRLLALLAPRALGQAQRMLADRAEAEDVVQEAMIRLWRMAPDWVDGGAKVSTWLYRVVANLCTDRLRKRPNSRLDEIAEPEDPALGAEDRIMLDARHDALSNAFASLPERQAQAVALRHLEGLPNPEIAEILGLSTEAVESLIARGKRALVAKLSVQKAELGYGDA